MKHFRVVCSVRQVVGRVDNPPYNLGRAAHSKRKRFKKNTDKGMSLDLSGSSRHLQQVR